MPVITEIIHMAGFATSKEAKEASIRLIRKRQPSFPGRHAVTFSLGESEHWAEAEHVREVLPTVPRKPLAAAGVAAGLRNGQDGRERRPATHPLMGGQSRLRREVIPTSTPTRYLRSGRR